VRYFVSHSAGWFVARTVHIEGAFRGVHMTLLRLNLGRRISSWLSGRWGCFISRFWLHLGDIRWNFDWIVQCLIHSRPGSSNFLPSTLHLLTPCLGVSPLVGSRCIVRISAGHCNGSCSLICWWVFLDWSSNLVWKLWLANRSIIITSWFGYFDLTWIEL
jgi:hypothetical protein